MKQERNHVYDTKKGSARSWRVIYNSELQKRPSGQPCAYTETAARKALAKLEGIETAATTAKQEALDTAEREANTRVLNTSRRRLDGLTHEQATERMFEAPPPILCVVSTRRQIVLIQGRTRGTYTLDRAGQVVSVEIAELDGGVIYTGTLTQLEAGGTKTKYAVKLAQWRRIGRDALARHTPPQAVGS